MAEQDVEYENTGDSALDSLRGKSLKTAGYAYLVGDAGLFASGLMAGRNKEAVSGLLWGIGGLACAKYGNPSADKQLELLSRRLGQYLKKQGVEIPSAPDTQLLTKEGGVVDHIEEFLYKYPSQVLNATYAVGGVQLLRSGLQHGKPWDAASGALVTAGALGGLLIPEKKPDPDHPPHGMFEKAKAWIQEKPLRLSGGLYALNNVTLILSALGERKANPGQKSYLFKFLTAASYIFGNAMLAMSSKGHTANGEDNIEVLGKLGDAAAKVIAAQPPELQAALVAHIAGYLSSQPEVHLKSEEIAALLQQKLHATSLAQPLQGWQQRLYDHNGMPTMPHL